MRLTNEKTESTKANLERILNDLNNAYQGKGFYDPDRAVLELEARRDYIQWCLATGEYTEDKPPYTLI